LVTAGNLTAACDYVVALRALGVIPQLDELSPEAFCVERN